MKKKESTSFVLVDIDVYRCNNCNHIHDVNHDGFKFCPICGTEITKWEDD